MYSDGPGEAGIGVRVAVYWEAERKTFAGVVTKFDHHDHEYLVEYEADDTQAWHEWEDLTILPERSPRLKSKRPSSSGSGLDGLLMLAAQSGSQSRSGSEDSGLLALSELASANEEPCTLKEYARAVEEKVNIKLDHLRHGEQTDAFSDAISEIKNIVTQAIDCTKGKLGRGTVISCTTMTLG